MRAPVPSPDPGSAASRAAVCGGVFAVAGATLMYEVLLTRVFSVTMWYHFAFLAVSAALLGMTAGALLVQLRPRHFTADALPRHLATYALLFAVGAPVTFFLHLAIPFAPTLTATGLLSILLTYGVVALPFVASGVAICLALTRLGGALAGPVGTVYAADLAGAATGCLVTVAALKLADAPAAVFLVGAFGGAGALLLAGATRARWVGVVAIVTTLAGLGVAGARPSWLHLTWVKGVPESGPTLYERWNSFSRVRISGHLEDASAPFGWGLSPLYPRDRRVGQLMLSIDAIADTVLTRFDGDLTAVEHLRHDVTNLAHYLRHDAEVLVVGAGGGRDVLAALAFGQRRVLAIEVNEAILDALNDHFADYTGHLDRRPSVEFVNDEARSYVGRLGRRFDIIQISFIDTFAASAAGAYVLTEHSLYTVEAWQTFLERLSPDGILSVSRWYFHRAPAEIHRLVTLATASLLAAGVPRPRDHLMLVRARAGADPAYREAIGVGTLLVARRPLSSDDLARGRAVAERLGFDVVLDPEIAAAPLEGLTAPETLGRAIADSPLDISPPTDDRPFFFHTVPLAQALRLATYDQGNVSFNVAAVVVLVGAVAVVAVLAAACLAGMRAVRRRHGEAGAVRPCDAVFFAAIGLGYILVEISQLHRLSVFLGHPTYGLVVVLFGLLLSSGLGSLAARGGHEAQAPWQRARPLLAVPVALAVFGLLTPAAINTLRSLETNLRIGVAVALLLPIGVVMGMAFPRGLELVNRRAPAATPWLWAVNGVTSVLGSLLAVLVSISAGISAAFWLGVSAYAVAAGAGLRMAGAHRGDARGAVAVFAGARRLGRAPKVFRSERGLCPRQSRGEPPEGGPGPPPDDLTG